MAKHTDSRHDDPRINAALADYFERVDRGETVPVEAFLAQHAEIATELRSLLLTSDDLVQLGRARSLAASAPSEVSTRSVAEQNVETIAPQRVQAPTAGETVLQRLPDTFGRYRIIRPLGSGAMGDVYLAEDSQLHRQVALKTPSFDADETGELLERFYREARSAAVLRHPNICPVFDVGEINGRHYISMAYIAGQPLSAYIRPDKPQPERQALAVIRKLALALQEAHDHGIIHRDLKPGNVIIDRKGEPIVMDFGLARAVQSEAGARLTQSGMLVGSPAYMSPEQVEGDASKLTPATDQYSLGVILYELLTGRLPFRGGVTAVIGAILTKEPTPPCELRPDLDPRVAALCQKMISKSPEARFESMRAVADAIAGILKSDPVRPAATLDAAPPAAPAKPPATLKKQPGSAPAAASVAAAAASVTASSVESLFEAAGKCMRKHDYEQVVQLLEAVPEHKRNDQVRKLLNRARELADEVTFLLAEIDEALRLNDNDALGRKADALLKVKPGHHTALQIKEELSRYGKGRIWQAGGWTPDGRRIGEGSWIPWLPLSIFAGVFGVSLLLVTLYLRVGDAIVRVQISHPDIEVGIQDRTLNIKSANQDIKVDPGEDTLTVSFQGAEFQTDKFTLNKGENPAIVVELLDQTLSAKFGDLSIGEWPVEVKTEDLAAVTEQPTTPLRPPAMPLESPGAEPAVAAVAVPADASGWIDLFNGRDLTGWQPMESTGNNDEHRPSQGGWEVRNGELVCATSKAGWLRSTEQYSDFVLHVEFKLQAGSNTDVYVRCPGQGRLSKTGMAVQVIDEHSGKFLMNRPDNRPGAIWGAYGHDKSAVTQPLGEWNTLDIRCEGARVQTEINGRQLIDADLQAVPELRNRPRAGFIGLANFLGEANGVAFRNIRIRELVPIAAEDAGWTDLFNGRDLAGWKLHQSNGKQPPIPWTADSERKVLVAHSGGHNWLETDAVYQDFVLTFDWRFPPGKFVSPNGSGVVVRADGLNSINYDPKGIEIDLLRSTSDDKTRGPGAFVTYDTPIEHKSGATPDRGNDMKGTNVEPQFLAVTNWNTCEIACQGDRLTVTMNGVVVNEATSVPQRAGRICLRNQDTDIEFRNVRIRATDGSDSQQRTTTVATLQGTWTAVAQEIGGSRWTNEQIQQHQKSIAFSGDRFEIRYVDRMGIVQMERGTYQLASGQEPVHIDMKGTNRGGRAIEFVGIIQVEGNELRHCFVKTSDNAAAVRPTSFSTAAGQFSTTYHREGSGGVPTGNGADSGWSDLFNGRDLTGWSPVASDGAWSVQNGILTATPGSGWLATDRDYGDFELELEYRLPAGGNTGVFLRAPLTGAASGVGLLEVQAIDDAWPAFKDISDRNHTGAVVGLFPASSPAMAPADAWNKMAVRIEASRITVVVNGLKVCDGDLSKEPQAALKPDMLLPQGRVGLQHRSNVEFRNIRIRELAPEMQGTAPTAAPVANLPRNEWINLDPSAETCTSWNYGEPLKNPQHKLWTNDTLVLDNAAVAYNHVQARDVSIKAKVKFLAGNNMALVVRSEHGKGGLYAYIDRIDKERVRVAFLDTKHERTLKVNDEFEFELTAIGNHATIKVDDKTVVDYPNVKIMRSGHVETTAYKARGTFKNMQVKILDP